jgi:hypothetical protein
MIDNWRLFGRVRVGLSCVSGEDSLLCLLTNLAHCLLHYMLVRDIDRMFPIVPS